MSSRLEEKLPLELLHEVFVYIRPSDDTFTLKHPRKQEHRDEATRAIDSILQVSRY